MVETPQEYRSRLISNLKGDDPRKIQAATPAKIARLIDGRASAILRKRPAPNKWSVHEIIVHLSDTEIAYAFRLRMTLGKPGTPLASYDQDDWADSGHYAKRDLHISLAQFEALREANLALYKALRPKQWKQFGIHAERGEESVETLFKLVAGHDLNHLAQIERILRPIKRR